MESIDSAITIWQQVAPKRFRTALENLPDPCPVCLNKLDFIRVQIEGNGEVVVPCVCQTADYAREVFEHCLTANKLETAEKQKDSSQLERYGTPEQWNSLVLTAQSLRSLMDSPFKHKWITIFGVKGCGKSHLMLATLNKMDKYAVYFYCDTLGNEIFASLDRDSTIDLKQKLIRAPVLLLDDLGTEPANSPFVSQFINGVIGARYQRGIYAPTVITTNLSEAALDARYDRMADRILDRHLVIQHHITLPSFRRLGKE